MEPIKCPKCGAIVKVTAIRFPDIEWKCLMCGESGSIKQGATSVYIQKVDEPDLGIGVTTTNAEGITTIDPKSTACDIPAPKWTGDFLYSDIPFTVDEPILKTEG